MNPLLGAILVLETSLAAAAAQDQQGPQPEYRVHLEAYQAASGAFRKATTDLQRKTAVEQLGEFPRKFLDLADRNRADPVALQALQQAIQAVDSVDSLAQHAWEMNRTAFPAGSRDGSARRIAALLLRDHVKSDKLGPICERMRFGVRTEYEEFLSAALRVNPDRNVQGLACLALAQLLNNHVHMVDLVEDRPDLIERYRFVFGEEFLRAIRGTGRAALVRRIEALYEQADQYGDVKLPVDTTVAKKARTELFSIRRLSLGKLAPDIEGKDQSGRRFKLSEYRGKVVLLYFWNEF